MSNLLLRNKRKKKQKKKNFKIHRLTPKTFIKEDEEKFTSECEIKTLAGK